jgi:hypothetical protein
VRWARSEWRWRDVFVFALLFLCSHAERGCTWTAAVGRASAHTTLHTMGRNSLLLFSLSHSLVLSSWLSSGWSTRSSSYPDAHTRSLADLFAPPPSRWPSTAANWSSGPESSRRLARMQQHIASPPARTSPSHLACSRRCCWETWTHAIMQPAQPSPATFSWHADLIIENVNYMKFFYRLWNRLGIRLFIFRFFVPLCVANMRYWAVFGLMLTIWKLDLLMQSSIKLQEWQAPEDWCYILKIRKCSLRCFDSLSANLHKWKFGLFKNNKRM